MSPAIGPLHPAAHAAIDPRRAATITAASGEVRTYADLAASSLRIAQLMQHSGLGVGDHVAIMIRNEPIFLEVCWAALRSGLYLSTINVSLTPAEAAYIVADSGSRAVVIDACYAEVAGQILHECAGTVNAMWTVNGSIPGCVGLDEALRGAPDVPIAETEGSMMLYSSGTTGRPKGIVRPLSGRPAGTSNPLAPFTPRLQMDESTVYLCPAPLHHAAPIGFSLTTQRLGGTVVLMERFEPEAMLAAIERYRVTHVQLVPTMFVRLLKLPPELRARYDLSSLRRVVHAAAPCAPDVKRAMIDWWGPIIDEYYSGTEGVGITYITSSEWLAHPGSVGRTILGEVHIVDESGNEVAPTERGTVFFSSGLPYSYHGDATTASHRSTANGWATLDDVGWVDDDGYLYLTDRRTYMIVSGGVNVYPRESEDVLITHPAVLDVRGDRYPRSRDGRGCPRRRATRRSGVCNARAGRAVGRVLSTASCSFQVSPWRRLRRATASPRERQALQAHAARAVLARPRLADHLISRRAEPIRRDGGRLRLQPFRRQARRLLVRLRSPLGPRGERPRRASKRTRGDLLRARVHRRRGA